MEHNLLKQLYEKYAGQLYLYIYSFCRDSSAAEDTMHDVFVKALTSLDDDHQNFKAWLYQVARNTALNRIKKETPLVLTDQFPEQPGDDTLNQLLQNERDEFLYRSMLCLPDQYRQVLILQYITGMPQAQIGSVLNISPGNVRILSYRARQRLKEEMEEENEI